MTHALTGETATIDFRDKNYFPLTYPLLFPHGAICGWHPEMKSTTGHKITLAQWVTQLLATEPRFERMGPLTNEFLIDVFSCIEDQRLSFHVYNQDQYRTSHHYAAAAARVPRPRRDGSPPVEKIIIPSSFTQGFADQAKKLTESLALVRHFGPAHYFLTMTCNTVSTAASVQLFHVCCIIIISLHHSLSFCRAYTHDFVCINHRQKNIPPTHQEWPEIKDHLHPGQTAFDRADLCARIFRQKLDVLLQVTCFSTHPTCSMKQ